MPTPSSPDAPAAPPSDGDAERERREIERGVYERRNFEEKQRRANPGAEDNRRESGDRSADRPGAAGLDSTAYGGGAGPEAGRAREGVDLDPSLLTAPDAGGGGDAGLTAGDAGGGNAVGFGASLGAGPRAETAAPTPERVDGDNEQDAAMKAHARAQSGDPKAAAPDQTRAQATLGSINETEGL